MSLEVEFLDDISRVDLSKDYSELMVAAFDQPVAQIGNTYRQKHLDNVFGSSFGGFVFENGTLIAMNLFWKWQFARGGSLLHAAQSCDNAVHPHHQRKGLFSKIERVCMSRIPGDSIRYGFPNSASTPGWRKQGWTFANVYRKCIYLRNSISFIRWRAFRGFKDFVPVEPQISNPQVTEGSELDEFFTNARKTSRIWRTNYSTELLRWRMRLNERLRCQFFFDGAGLIGLMLYTISQLARVPDYKMISIVDVVSDSVESHARHLRHGLIEFLGGNDISEIQHRSTLPSQLIDSLGFKAYSSSSNYILHPAYGWNGAQSMKAFIGSAGLTAFDSDHV